MNSSPSAPELRARIVAALLPGPGEAGRAGMVAQAIVEDLPAAVVADLVDLLEAPLAASHRVNAALLAERFHTTARPGQTSTVEGQTR